MTNSSITTAFGLGLVLWLTACASSPPTTYYRLTPREGLTVSGQAPSLGIGPVEIPEYLNRRSLVHSESGNQLRIFDQERWAEPLDDGILRVVGLNLANLLNTQNLRYFPWDPRRAPDYSIRIKLLALDADDLEATLVAEWLLSTPGDAGVASDEAGIRRISQLQQVLPSGKLRAAQLAPAYSELLYRLSELIAAQIRSEQAPATAN